MFGLFRHSDQLTLSNAPLYLNEASIDPFVFFVNNVSIKSELSFVEESSLERLQEALGKALSAFGIKLIAPLRTLALRFLEANHGFLELHTIFLAICRYLHTPADALPVLEYPGMFKHMRKHAQIDFILQACDIYIQLRRYSQAHEWAVRGGRIEMRDERTAAVAKKLIILSIYMGKPLRDIGELTNRAFNILEQNLAMMSDQVPLGRKDKDWEKERAQREQAIYIYRVIFGIKEWRKISEDQERVLAHEGLLQVFNESQYSSLRNYIESEVKGQNWRIRASQVKGQQVGKLEVARGVNQAKEVYKFDSQERLMYFNHRVCSPKQLDQLITKSYLMQNEVNNCKIQRKEADQFSRMGMMGGMGMGGHFSFGGMGMGGSKKRRGGDRGDMFDID